MDELDYTYCATEMLLKFVMDDCFLKHPDFPKGDFSATIDIKTLFPLCAEVTLMGDSEVHVFEYQPRETYLS